jgi:hypothetical protein
VDRELYIPQEWAADGERRLAAGIPESLEFATKPQLARRMLERALDRRSRPGGGLRTFEAPIGNQKVQHLVSIVVSC